MEFTFIDLFCGIGGFRQVMESMMGTCVFSSDKNKNTRLTYHANYGEIPSGDFTKIKAEDIPLFNVMCAVFPCQPFSIAGKQRGFADKRGTLFFELAQVIKYRKPEVVFLENVANLEKHDNGNTLKVIIRTLKSSGYDVPYEVLNSKDYGVAQIRRWIHIVCFRKDLKAEFSFPEYFVFPVKEERPYEQLGNSVAVPVLKATARQIASTNIFEDVQNDPGQVL